MLFGQISKCLIKYSSQDHIDLIIKDFKFLWKVGFANFLERLFFNIISIAENIIPPRTVLWR